MSHSGKKNSQSVPLELKLSGMLSAEGSSVFHFSVVTA